MDVSITTNSYTRNLHTLCINLKIVKMRNGKILYSLLFINIIMRWKNAITWVVTSMLTIIWVMLRVESLQAEAIVYLNKYTSKSRTSNKYYYRYVIRVTYKDSLFYLLWLYIILWITWITTPSCKDKALIFKIFFLLLFSRVFDPDYLL